MPAVGFTAADFLGLFRPGAAWERAEAHVRVFKLYSQFVSTAIQDGGSTDAQLRAVLAALKEHHIALGLEAGLLTSPALCGHIEGYTCAGIGALVGRIKALGGTLEYVGMDEPLWFGHSSTQAGALRTPIADLAANVATQVDAIHRYFPKARIGDIEPVAGAAGPADYPAQVVRFAAAYRAATGLPLAFFHADVAWRASGWQLQLQQLARVAHARGERFGIIYDGSDPAAATSVEWTSSAEQNFATIERDPRMVPDDAILQTWNAQPDRALPETRPGTMTSLIDRYLAAETIITARRTGHGFAGRLATYDGPVGNTGLRAYAIDDGSLAITTTASLRSSVPAGAASALVGLRINTECGCDGPVNIWLGPAAYVDDTSHRSAARILAHASVVRAAGQTALVNSAPFPVSAGDTFTFSLPMQVPYSARDGGYVAIIFLDGTGTEVARMALPFRPGQRPIWAGTTDSDGRFGLTLPPRTPVPSIVRVDFSGSARYRRSSASVQ